MTFQLLDRRKPRAIGVARRRRGDARSGALAAFAGTFLVLVAAGSWVTERAGLGASFTVVAATSFLAIAILALRGLDRHPHIRFGPANVVTTARAAIAVLVAAFATEAGALVDDGRPDIAWALAAAVCLSLALDGVDGALARRTGLSSSYGARFDMEIDAFLVLALSVLAFAMGKAGAFVLLIGAMRYLFLLLLVAAPRLSGDLAPSLRRKTVCVVQIAVLAVLLLPPVVPPMSQVLAVLALAALLGSFAADIFALARHARKLGP